jgi:hypothetical protein
MTAMKSTALALAALLGGCSFIAVRDEPHRERQRILCDSYVGPVFDTLVGGTGLVLTGLAVNETIHTHGDTKRVGYLATATVVTLSIPFVVGAIMGYRDNARCRRTLRVATQRGP